MIREIQRSPDTMKAAAILVVGNTTYLDALFLSVTLLIWMLYFSRDCPIFYMRMKVQIDLQAQDNIVARFGEVSW